MSVGFSADTDDDGTGTTGTIHNAAWKAAMAAAIDALVGSWTVIAFNAANFTGNGSMSVTVGSGDVKRNRFQLVNKCLHWQFTGRAISVGGTPDNIILFTVPTGSLADAESRSFNVQVSDNGTLRDAKVVAVDATHIGVMLQSEAAFAAATDATNVAFDISFEVS